MFFLLPLYTVATISLSWSIKNGVIDEKWSWSMKNGVIDEKWIWSGIHCQAGQWKLSDQWKMECSIKNRVLNEKWSDWWQMYRECYTPLRPSHRAGRWKMEWSIIKNGVLNEKWSDLWKIDRECYTPMWPSHWAGRWKMEWSMTNGVINEKLVGSIIHCCDHLV